jgi:O-antigen/teichoic acid export membrane protein
VLKNLSLKGLSLGLERVCRLGVVVASARVLGETDFGRFVFASTVTTFLALGADLGLGVWSTRALARNHGDTAPIVRVGLVLRSIMAAPFAVAVAAAAFAVQGETRAAMLLMGVAALGSSLVDHVGALLRGYERFADEARLNTSRALLTLGAGMVALRFIPSLVGLCAALAAASVGSLVIAAGALFRMHPSRTAAMHVGSFDRVLAKAALQEAVPIWLAGLLSIVYFKADHLFIRWFAGDDELGAYGAAYKFFEGSMVVPAVLLAVAFPRLARAHGDEAAQRSLELRVSLVLFGLGSLAALVCLFGAAPLVRLVFGPAYGRAVPSLRVLSLGVPLLYFNYGLTHFLVARDRERSTLGLALMMLVLAVGLNLLLIPRMLGPGAAWATTLSEAALTLGCLAALRRKGTESSPRPSLQATPRTDPGSA